MAATDVYEWWHYAEAGWSVLRYAAASREEALAVAVAQIHTREPFAFGIFEGNDSSPARAHPGRVAVCAFDRAFGATGDGPAPWAVRIAVPSPRWQGDRPRMGRFYRKP